MNKYDHFFDIIVMTETWNSLHLNFGIDGYNNYVSKNDVDKAEGVSVYLRKEFNVTTANIDKIEECSSVDIDVQIDNTIITITAVYKSFDRIESKFLDSLDEFISKCKSENHIICGDMNIDVASW